MTLPNAPTSPDIRSESPRTTERARRSLLAYVSFAVGLVAAPGPIYLAVVGRTWQYGATGASFIILAIASAAAIWYERRGHEIPATWAMIAGASLAAFGLSAAINELGVLTACAVLILVPALARSRLQGRDVQMAIYIGLGSALIALLVDAFDIFPALPQPLSTTAITAIDALVILALGLIVARQFNSYRLRTKLIITFLLIALTPIGLLTYLNSQSSREALRTAADQKLAGAASQTAAVLDAFVNSHVSNITAQSQLVPIVNYLSLPETQRANSPEEADARQLLLLLAKEDPINARTLGVLDASGNNLIDISSRFIGSNEADRDYFEQAVNRRTGYASSIELAPSTGEPLIFFSSPVFDARSRVIGVLRLGLSATAIQNLIDQSASLAGPGSLTALYDQHFINLVISNSPQAMLTPVTRLAPDVRSQLVAAHMMPASAAPVMGYSPAGTELFSKLQQSSAHPIFQAPDPADQRLTDEVAVARTTTQAWSVAFFQPESLLFTPEQSQTRNSALLALLVAAGVTLAALVVSEFISGPITALTNVAVRVTEGDLTAQAEEGSQDEIGMMARAFNGMTDRLRALIAHLEGRVQERTVDLERRARQLQAAGEIARDAAGIRDVDDLLNEAVRLISDRFGFYHAGVFLLDPAGEYAVLRAASSEGGRRMLAAHHRLGVGKVGIVGYATGTGKPRIALDVGADAVHFANPDLPKTRSEMALPLLVGDTIIGALDVQSVEPNAFDQEDVITLQTMADQLAIAIENARLLSRQTELAQQRRRAIEIYRQLSQHMGYDQIISDVTRLIRGAYGYERVTLGLLEGNEIVLRSASAKSQTRLPRLGQGVAMGQGLLGRAAAQQRPVHISPSVLGDPQAEDPILGQLPTALAVPLTSRGRSIGALSVETHAEATFSPEEVELIELLASQVSVSIENARLFEETQQSLRQVNLLYQRQTAEAWENVLSSRRTQGRDTEAAFGESELPDDSPAVETPIALRGEVIGKLDLLAPSRGALSEEDQEILHAVADEVAGHLEQLRLIEEVQRRATQMETAAEIARVATGLLDLDGLLERAVHLIRDRFGYYNVSLYLMDQKGNHAVLRQSAGQAEATLLRERPRVEVGARSILGFVTRSGEYYVAHEVENDPYFIRNPLLPETQAQLAVPLRVGEEVIGALDVQASGPYAFSEDDIAVLGTLADQMAVAVQNARSYEEAIRRAEREQKVLQITSRIRSSTSIDDMLKTAIQEIRSAVGARAATIRLSGVPVDGGQPMDTEPEANNGHGSDGETASREVDG